MRQQLAGPLCSRTGSNCLNKVLQTPLLIINSFDQPFVKIFLKHLSIWHSQEPGILIHCSPTSVCHVSCFMCQLSCAKCCMSRICCNYFLNTKKYFLINKTAKKDAHKKHKDVAHSMRSPRDDKTYFRVSKLVLCSLFNPYLKRF